MKLIVGLGNPGEKYSRNRHNVGFVLVNMLANELGLKWDSNPKLKADICKKSDLILMKSQEFMNSSGIPISLVANFFKIDIKDLLIIHDDVDLPLGEAKRQFAAGAAGHHGVESIITNLGTKEFWRIRVGIGRPDNGQRVEDFVLDNFSQDELEKIQNINVEKFIS